MARIPDDQIERLKQDISLVRLAERQSITLKKHGKDYLGLCPFHDDHEPSLAIAEEEGAENASYALKLLQSEGELTIASTGKDETTGNLVTKQYRVEGPVMLFLTTTAIDIDEELMNRCLVLTVNESREQTQAIHAMQRKQQTLDYIEATKQDIETANALAHEVLGRTLDELPPQTCNLLKQNKC